MTGGADCDPEYEKDGSALLWGDSFEAVRRLPRRSTASSYVSARGDVIAEKPYERSFGIRTAAK